jgi:osmotically-inducible protein OsmY
MQAAFEYKLKQEVLFCKQCSAVRPHTCFTRVQIHKISGISPRECILASCSTCEENQILLARDLRSLTAENSAEFSCKIAGRGRILLDDWVYIPGHARPGKVKSRFRKENKEHLSIHYEDGSERTLIQDIPNEAGKSAMINYKLLPFQLASTLIGDHIYHVGRNKTGRAVGFAHNEQSKLLIQLEDETFLIMNLPGDSTQVIKNNQLLEIVRHALSGQESFTPKNLSVRVSQGIVYLEGVCDHLQKSDTLVRFIESLEGVMAVISHIHIQPNSSVADYDLELLIHQALFDQPTGVFGLELEVREGIAYLRGYMEDEETAFKIYRRISSIDGLRAIKLKIQLQENPSYHDIELARQVMEALRKNTAINSSRLRVSALKGVIYLEGSVQSNLQKSTAAFSAMWAGRNLKVINNLKVIPRLDSRHYRLGG